MNGPLATSALDPARVAAVLRRSYDSDLGEARSFLPRHVPLDVLPPPLDGYLSACAELPSRYPEEFGGVRPWLDRLFRREDRAVSRAVAGLTAGECETLMTALSALAHTYRWDRVPPPPERFAERHIELPPGIGGPWTQLARALDQPRVGTTWSLHLCNWKLDGAPGGSAYRVEELTAGTVRVARNWLAPPTDGHLERFSLSFVLMEARGAAVLRHIVDAVEGAAARRLDDVLAALEGLHRAVEAMTLSFSMNVRKRTVDPAIWLKLVQPTFAWSVETGPGCPVGGPSGMQVPVIQALDAALGVAGESVIARAATAGRALMPRAHRRFLHSLDLSGPLLRGYVAAAGCPDLTTWYNRCVADLISFRATHRSRGALYLSYRPEGGTERISTGLTIGVGDDPLEVFRHTMTERTSETRAAVLTCLGRPSEVLQEGEDCPR